jgi:hypothetical protein
MVKAGNYCTAASGKFFREADRITNTRSQLDTGMFRQAESIEITLKLMNGDVLTANIPMRGFGERRDAAR